jgi:hypothetical protein
MMETHTYSRNLDLEEIIGLIKERENFFNLEKLKDLKRVNITCTKMKVYDLGGSWWPHTFSNKLKIGF